VPNSSSVIGGGVSGGAVVELNVHLKLFNAPASNYRFATIAECGVFGISKGQFWTRLPSVRLGRVGVRLPNHGQGDNPMYFPSRGTPQEEPTSRDTGQRDPAGGAVILAREAGPMAGDCLSARPGSAWPAGASGQDR
jgi:hypothetical protein